MLLLVIRIVVDQRIIYLFHQFRFQERSRRIPESDTFCNVHVPRFHVRRCLENGETLCNETDASAVNCISGVVADLIPHHAGCVRSLWRSQNVGRLHPLVFHHTQKPRFERGVDRGRRYSQFGSFQRHPRVDGTQINGVGDVLDDKPFICDFVAFVKNLGRYPQQVGGESTPSRVPLVYHSTYVLVFVSCRPAQYVGPFGYGLRYSVFDDSLDHVCVVSASSFVPHMADGCDGRYIRF
mmetsp:Transcript_5327/g.9719  ORF Transcript_5327/g.9719 Transcript_5327/m.9719 type:complete len:238 (-) Transcript_5327:466-1179(-)